jgi:hypothetical protein
VNSYLNFQLIGQPDLNDLPAEMTASPDKDLLIVFRDNLPFLERILGAAGFQTPAEQLHLLAWAPEDGPLDLTGLARHLRVEKIILFGQSLPSLGLHFQLTDYFPVEIAGRRFLKAPALDKISAAKDAGNNGPAGLLWKAIQNGFLRET